MITGDKDTYVNELASWIAAGRKTTKPRRRETVAAFLAIRENVKEAIAAGYALKTIWENMHETGRISFRYETFLRHVRRLITNAPPVPPTLSATVNHAARENSGKQAIPKASGELIKSALPEIKSFNFDPSPKLEDLL